MTTTSRRVNGGEYSLVCSFVRLFVCSFVCSRVRQAPNIDHSQDFVKRDLGEWLVWLRTHVGFDGFRLDFAKGFHGA
jgi:hypothetical protein